MSAVIEVENLTKTFRLRTVRSNTLKEKLLINFWKSGEYRELHALDDVSFEVEKGRTVGILGSNGSGKSTLLRVLAGITPATSGRVAVQGRSSSLIDLTAGMEADLSGIENIYLNASVLGLSRREIQRRLSDVVDFAELGYYIHSPIRYYSTGMLMRLAFSIAVHLDPDILLVDEALAVGDLYFQAKSLERMRKLRRTRDTTILVVTHSIDIAEEMCDEVLWIEKGRLLFRGSSRVGLDRILMEHHRHVPSLDQLQWSNELMYMLIRARFGTGEIVIRGVRFIDPNDQETCSFRTGERFCLEIDFEKRGPVHRLVCGVGIEREDGLACTLVNSDPDVLGTPVPEKGTLRAILDPFEFLPGRYRLTVAFLSPGDPPVVYDLHLLLYLFRVLGDEDDEPTEFAYLQKAEFSLTPT